MSLPNSKVHTSPWLTVVLLCLGQTMIILDQNIVNVALPVIQRGLALSDEHLVWVVNAYVVPFGGLLLFAGRLGDLVGRKSVFLTGVGLFAAASVACGVAQSPAVLFVSRFLQGIGGAVASACILGLVATVFVERRRQAQAIAAYSFASAGGGALGPLLGGMLTELLSWHWIFLVNAPLGAVLVAFGARVLPRERGEGLGRGTDFLGAALVTLGMMLLVYTLVDAQRVGWGAPRTLLLGAVAACMVGGFVVRQARLARPLLPLRLFRARNLVAANAVQFLLIAGMFGLLYFGTLYLQRGLGFSALQAGFGFVPIAATIATVSLGLSARLLTRFGPRLLLLVGVALSIGAFALLSLAPADGSYATHFLPAGLVMGLGFGLAGPAGMSLGMATVAPEDSGIASGLLNTAQQLGGAIGLAVLSVLAGARTHAVAASGAGTRDALVGGYQTAFLAAAGFAATALLVGAVVLWRPAATAIRSGGSSSDDEEDVPVG